MADVTAAAVKALRELTDLPMMDCKKALVEADGDQDRAVEILKENHQKVMIKRADNPTSEGIVKILIADDASEAALISLECESAPVAANDEFLKLAELCAKQLLEGPGAENSDELIAQLAPDGSGKTLADLHGELVNKIREKIILGTVVRVAGPVGGYVHHDGKTGVLFRAEGDKGDVSILRDVSMHIAALKPSVTQVEELDEAAVQAERDRLSEEAKATGKPENIIGKIVDGRMKNYYVEQGVLVMQPFAKDDSKTVSQALAEHGFTAVGFTRCLLGV